MCNYQHCMTIKSGTLKILGGQSVWYNRYSSGQTKVKGTFWEHTST